MLRCRVKVWGQEKISTKTKKSNGLRGEIRADKGNRLKEGLRLRMRIGG